MRKVDPDSSCCNAERTITDRLDCSGIARLFTDDDRSHSSPTVTVWTQCVSSGEEVDAVLSWQRKTRTTRRRDETWCCLKLTTSDRRSCSQTGEPSRLKYKTICQFVVCRDYSYTLYPSKIALENVIHKFLKLGLSPPPSPQASSPRSISHVSDFTFFNTADLKMKLRLWHVHLRIKCAGYAFASWWMKRMAKQWRDAESTECTRSRTPRTVALP